MGAEKEHMQSRRVWGLILALIIAPLALLSLAGVVRSADGSVPTTTPGTTDDVSDKITEFDSNIFITRAGTAQIIETITYSNDAPHHGLERFVPTVLTDNGISKTYYFQFKLISVQNEEGKDYQLSRHDSMTAAGLRIGDPDKTFTGAATYIIKYELTPVISKQEGFDFLNLNITGNDWRVPILQAKSRLSIEGEPRLSEIKCFVGASGSKAEDCLIAQDGDSYKITSIRSIDQGQGMTINAKLPAGYFASYIKPTLIPPFWWLWRWAYGWLAAIIVLGLALAFRYYRKFKYWRAKKDQTIIAQYEAPDSMKPAEIGLLSDNHSAMPEITATLIDLAIRKYIKIDQVQAKTWIRAAKYKFSFLKPDKKGLESYENDLLTSLFENAETSEQGIATIELDKVSATKMSLAISAIQSKINQRLEEKGYYPSSGQNALTAMAGLWRLPIIVKILGALFILTGIVSGLQTFAQTTSFIPLGVFCGALVASVFIIYFKRPTAKGVQEWAKVEGFKLFLSVTEKDRLKFSDAPAKNPKLFSKMLPYAVALGVEKEWAKQFEGMDMQGEMYWHGSSSGGNFTPSLFAANISTMTSQFSSSVSAGFSAGSSGGGAGGGAGGGGGGGW